MAGSVQIASTLLALAEASRDRAGGRSLRIKPRRTVAGQAEGRWSHLNPSPADSEDRLRAWAVALLDRIGIASTGQDHDRTVDAALDEIAAVLEAHLDMDALVALALNAA